MAGNRGFFDVEASSETLERTNMRAWSPGRRINLERALKLGDELGGHMVTGHIDGVAMIAERRDEGAMARFTFAVPGSPRPLHRRERLRLARRDVAHGERR